MNENSGLISWISEEVPPAIQTSLFLEKYAPQPSRQPILSRILVFLKDPDLQNTIFLDKNQAPAIPRSHPKKPRIKMSQMSRIKVGKFNVFLGTNPGSR